MATIIDTMPVYLQYLKKDRQCKDDTIRSITLSLSYLSELCGVMDTTELKATHLQHLIEMLKRRKKKRKNRNGAYETLSAWFRNKVMKHVKAFVKRMNDKRILEDLIPSEVPNNKDIRRFPKFLTFEEMNTLFTYLDNRVVEKKTEGKKRFIYAALLIRALMRMLYTSWLRNFEIRKLEIQDLDLDNCTAYVIGKWSKGAMVTYNDIAKEKLIEYLNYKKKLFPQTKGNKVFTAWHTNTEAGLSEYGLNVMLKKVAVQAGITKTVFAHLFRHTLATHLIMLGWHIVHVQNKLRHSSLAITSIYTHSDTQTQFSMTQNLWMQFSKINNYTHQSNATNSFYVQQMPGNMWQNM